jgi:hypothetical protein
MGIRTELLTEINDYLAASGVAESTFGVLSVNDGKLVGRLRAGKGITIETVERVRKYIADNPPTPAQPPLREAG